ncbi:MAG: hypothetical protein M1820_009885 [Bogoriella megaspora]|nr:MAG: hypothetical protein M1820_009885 [Bogoriella megaspora]
MTNQAPPPPYTDSGKSQLYHDTRNLVSDEAYARKMQQEYDSQYTHARGVAPQWPGEASSSSTGATSTSVPMNIPAQASNVPPALELHVYTTSMWTKFELDITTADKSRILLHAKFHQSLFRSRPDMIVHRGNSSGPVICTATFHSGLSSHANYEMQFPLLGRKVDMNRSGFWSSALDVYLEGQQYTIKGTHHEGGASKWSSGSLKLVDASGRTFAVFANKTHKSWDKQGTISFEVAGLSDMMIEQTICCFLVINEQNRRQNAASAASG